MIYIVEDDDNIRQMESYALKNSGFTVQDFPNGREFFAAIETILPDMIILDIMLPGEDGFAILKRLRSNPRTRQLPVMMVTAKDSELDLVKGLDSGADDYLTKPFGIMEFIARVKAMMRRFGGEGEKLLSFGPIVLDDGKRLVSVDGSPVSLTYKEFETLKCFMMNPGVVLSREKLMDRVWGTNFEGESRTVDMHIKTLRQKLGDAGRYIKTVRNVGYKLD